MDNHNKVYVVGENTNYQFGLDHKEDIEELTQVAWKDHNNKYIHVKKINVMENTTILTDKDGRHWAIGYNENGESGVNNNDSKEIKTPTLISFDDDEMMIIDKIWSNVTGKCVFFTKTNKNQLLNILSNWTRNCEMYQLSNDVIGVIIAYCKDTKVYGNGCNNNYQLGIGDNENRYKPIEISSLHNIKKLTSALNYSLALDIDGNVFSTTYSNNGGNGHGKGYKNNIKSYWLQVTELKEAIIDIQNNRYSSLFLSESDTVYTVGQNCYGQLGRGTDGNESHDILPIPYLIENKISITKISSGFAHSLCIDTHGKVWSFGYNGNGQCGDESHGRIIYEPLMIPSMKEMEVIDIKTGGYHSYLCTKDGGHYLFGSNEYNESTLIEDDRYKIYNAYKINEIVSDETNGGSMKEIELGYYRTFIIVCFC